MEANPTIAVDRATRVLEGAAFPWWVAGGWALDLHLGSSIRPRKDVDLAILRRDQSALRAHLAGWDLMVAVDGRLVPWLPDMWLDPPLHEVWARPMGSDGWVCEILMNDSSDTEWIYRRDPRVTYALDALRTSRSDSGFPILPPEIVLLYKSKGTRPGDEIDFAATCPGLAAPAAAWLTRAMTRLDPGHPWIRRIRDAEVGQ
jgi:hypothetical protein